MCRRSVLVYWIVLNIFFVAGRSEYGLKGQKVILKPDIRGQPDTILWKHNGNKVVEFNGQEQHTYGTYENRVSLDWLNADLEITDLRMDDSGEYELEVDVNRILYERTYKLEVVDDITEASITCAMSNGSGSTRSATLLCSAKPEHAQTSLTFKWTSHGSGQPGPKLKIPLGDEHDDKEYSCSVSNPLSAKTATFTAKECYTDKTSLGLIAGMVCAILLILIGSAVVIYCCKRRHIACFDEESVNKKLHKTQQTPRKDPESDGEARETSFLLRPPVSTAESAPACETVDETPNKGVDTLISHFGGGHRKRGSDEETNEASESSPPLAAGPTLSPAQPPHPSHPENNTDEHEEAPSRPSSELNESPPDPSDSEKEDKPDPDTLSDDSVGQQVPTVPENQETKHEEAASPHSCPQRASRPPPLDLEKEDKPDPNTVLDDTKSASETVKEPETPHKGHVREKAQIFDPKQPPENTHKRTESEKRKDNNEGENSTPAKVGPPTPKPRSQVPAQEVASGHKEDANLNQVKGQTEVSAEGKMNESDESSSDGQKDSDTPTNKGNQQLNLCVDNTNASQESPGPAHEDEDDDNPEGKVKTSRESDESSNDENESTRDNKQSGPKEEKTGQ